MTGEREVVWYTVIAYLFWAAFMVALLLDLGIKWLIALGIFWAVTELNAAKWWVASRCRCTQ